MEDYKILLNRYALADFLVGHRKTLKVGEPWFALLDSPRIVHFSFGTAIGTQGKVGRRNSFMVTVSIFGYVASDIVYHLCFLFFFFSGFY